MKNGTFWDADAWNDIMYEEDTTQNNGCEDENSLLEKFLLKNDRMW